MDPPERGDITRLLAESAGGDEAARERLLTLVHEELLRRARLQRRHHRPYDTLNTVALVNETYLKLHGRESADWRDRQHFYRVASRAMRDVLVDYARRRRAAKRGGGEVHLSLDDALELPDLREEEVLQVHEALQRLEQLDPRQGRVVELRYFVGLNIPETAAALGISPATVRRDWVTARAWLQREIESA